MNIVLSKNALKVILTLQLICLLIVIISGILSLTELFWIFLAAVAWYSINNIVDEIFKQ